MPDLLAQAAVNPLPAQVLKICFLSAIGVFGLGALFRSFFVPAAGAPPPLPAAEGDSELPVWSQISTPGGLPPFAPDSPYHPPFTTEVMENIPSTLAAPGIAVRYYHAFDLIWGGLLFLLFFSQAVLTASLPDGGEKVYNAGALFTGIVFQIALAGITMGIMVFRVRPAEWLGLRWRQWPWAFVIGPVGVVGMWILMMVLQQVGYMKWIQSLGGQMQETVKLLQESSDPLVLFLMAAAAVVIAPICEETVFRGFLYPVAKRFAGPGPAAFFSALVFAAAHGNLQALLPLFLLALVLLALYEKTGSIWAPISLHFCFNGATVLIQFILRHYHIPIESGV